MNVFAVQLDIIWEDKRANFERLRRLLRGARPPADSLIVLPEMFSTGFSLNLDATRQDQRREDESFLSEIAAEYRCCVIGGVVSPGDNGRGLNQSVAFSSQGELLARYTKIHPFTLGGESTCHARGSEVVTFMANGFQVAPFVCYDLRFPEVFRAAAARGAQLFAVSALWPVKRQQHWLTLLQARAIENQAYVIGVNRVGTEPQFYYAGRSVVVDPHGIIIADAGEQEGIINAQIDVDKVNAWRRDFPALRDAHWPAAKTASTPR
jgi:predicted amidohydrolase